MAVEGDDPADNTADSPPDCSRVSGFASRASSVGSKSTHNTLFSQLLHTMPAISHDTCRSPVSPGHWSTRPAILPFSRTLPAGGDFPAVPMIPLILRQKGV
jgi:hypothetical protein